MTIKRGPESYLGRTRRVEYGGLVHLVMSAEDKSVSIGGQTEECLAKIDALLAEAGTDKSRLVTATIYVADMALKDEMNDVWVAWADRDNPCARVCVGVELTHQADPSQPHLVEIAVSAAID
ncbi:MAG TPA: RidA family protein [Gammaproteobacteria bacterium]|nr:RidA family protein [Gammaproteobacteria bacterium]